MMGNILAGTLGHGYDNKFGFVKAYLRVLKGEQIQVNPRVYRASFSHPLKSIITMLTGVPFEILNDPAKKKEYIININTFEYKEGSPDRSIEELYWAREKGVDIDGWMTVNDFINYFGHHVCKRFIGKDIWTRCEEISTDQYPTPEKWRIYSDIRTTGEYEFIKKKGGKVIRINTSGTTGCIFDKKLNDVEVDEQIFIEDINDFYQVKTSDKLFSFVMGL